MFSINLIPRQTQSSPFHNFTYLLIVNDLERDLVLVRVLDRFRGVLDLGVRDLGVLDLDRVTDLVLDLDRERVYERELVLRDRDLGE
jgi:hypothetical protein